MPVRSLLVVAGAVAAASLTFPISAQTTTTFVPPPPNPPFVPDAHWSDPAVWDTGIPPINGQPGAGDTYNVIIREGNAQLDGDYHIQALTLGENADGSDTATLAQVGDPIRTLTVHDLFTWEAGTIFADIIVNAQGGIAFTTDDAKRLNVNTAGGKSIINHSGMGTWTAGHVSGLLNADPEKTSAFNNLAGSTFSATADGYRFSPRFNNAGVLNVDPGADGHIEMGLLFNDGTTNLLSGTLELDGLSFGSFTAVSSGDFLLSPGATLQIRGREITSAGSITGAGNVLLSSITMAGAYAVRGTTTIDGNVSLTGEATTGQLVLDGLNTYLIANGGFGSGSESTANSPSPAPPNGSPAGTTATAPSTPRAA